MSSPLKVSYKDYVIEQLAMSKNEKTAAYWRAELAEYRKYTFPEPFALSVDEWPHTSITPLPGELYAELNRVAQQRGVTVKTLCLAAFIGTLYMYSYEEDILIGLVENGRPVGEDASRILGCFLNTVPMRTTFAPGMTWEGLTRAVHDKQTELKRHGRMSLVSILEAIGERSDEENPLFDIAFNFIDFHVYESVAGLFEFMPFSFERTNVKLDFSVSVTLGELSVKTVSAYGREWSERLVGKFVHTLRLIMEQPEERISPTTWMSAAERQQLEGFNDTGADYPRDASVIELFERAAHRWADRPALVMDGEELEYRALMERVNAAAARLRKASVGPGQYVGLLAERSFEMIIGLLAIMKAGAAYVPLDPEFPNERLLAILSDCGANMLVVGDGLQVDGFGGPCFPCPNCAHR